MAYYKINIDGHIIVGEYRSIDNAVFGAMRMNQHWLKESATIEVERLPDRPVTVSGIDWTKKLREDYGHTYSSDN